MGVQKERIEGVLDQISGFEDKVIDHAVLGTVFSLGLIANPRNTVAALKRYGLRVIPTAYRIFFNNMQAEGVLSSE